jgi:hypothetical protein
MRLHPSSSLLSAITLSFGLTAGLGCAGVKQNATTTGSGGSGGSHSGNGGSNTGNSTGNGGTGPVPVTPISGNFTCTDFDTSGSCASFSTGNEGNFDNGASGSTSITYPLDHSLFPSNLGPIQIQMSTSGASARITFQTLASSNVNIQYFGSCESAPGSGCSVTLPLALTQMLVPACQTEDIQITARVLNGTSPTNDSAPINVAWAQAGLTGGLYYWTVIPNQPYCPSATMASPGTYCLEDTTQTPKNGTAIYRYDFSKDNPAPQQVWTDDGGPNSSPSYQGSPQSWNAGVAGGHCIGCHTITNDGKFMALDIGGSSTYNAANWELLDIGAQGLLAINPSKTGGSGCNDPSATATNDPTCYWQSYRKDAFATETAWGPNDDVMVSMFKSKLFFNTVAAAGTSATIAQVGPALPNSAAAIDPYQSDPFWSHDGSFLVYTSFNQTATADSTGNPGGLNGDLKKGGQIAIATATTESINDDAQVLVPRVPGVTSYYPCVSEDSNFVVFNQSTCGSDPDVNYGGTAGYGTGTCDGYDDSSAKLWWVSTAGNGSAISLDNANGGSANYDNSWPRFSPDVSTFRGQTLYWVAFSSRRPYGSQLNTGGLVSSQPQLWFSGVTSAEISVGDPSYAPVWLPGQNPNQATPYGNHVPQWVKVAIVIDKGSL